MANYYAAPHGKWQFFDSNGDPLSGGKLYTYASGTTTDLATYQTSTGTANTNPIVLDSRGECNLWLGDSTYTFLLTTSADVTVWTVDGIRGAMTTAILDDTGSSLIGFLQSGTSAVETTVQAKLRSLPKDAMADFDADGGGVANDAVAINAAITAADYEVVLQPGTYLVASTITGKSNFKLRGLGNVILKRSDASTAPVLTFTDKSNFSVENIHIDGNTAGGGVLTNQFGLRCDGCSDFVIDRVVAYGCMYDGLYFRRGTTDDPCSNFTVKNCETYSCDRHGIAVVSGENFTIENCYSHDNVFAGITVEPNAGGTSVANNYKISGCTCVDNGQSGHAPYSTAGIALAHANTAAEADRTNVIIEKCIVTGTLADTGDGYGIWARDVGGLTISNCITRGNDDAGIRVDRSTTLGADITGVVIEGNVVLDNGADGIYVAGGGASDNIIGAFIGSNVSNDNTGYGIAGGANVTAGFVAPNIAEGNNGGGAGGELSFNNYSGWAVLTQRTATTAGYNLASETVFSSNLIFQRRDLAAGQTNYNLYIPGILDWTEVPMPRAGSVLGLAVRLSAAIPGGEVATVKIAKNGTPTAMTIQLDPTETNGVVTAAKGTYTFAAEDRIGVVIDTSNNGSWAATTDIVATVETIYLT